jgi:hypothetical protein
VELRGELAWRRLVERWAADFTRPLPLHLELPVLSNEELRDLLDGKPRRTGAGER